MRKLTAYILLVAMGSAGSVFAQVSDDLNVDLTVTAQPGITITPGSDLSFTSDGASVAPVQGTYTLCFETSLTDLQVTLSKLNVLNNGLPSLTNTAIGDYVNYFIQGSVIGTGPDQEFNGTDTRSYDLSEGSLGGAPCAATEYRFVFTAAPTTNAAFPTRAISETVADNGLDDGTPYVFSDVLTITLEPAL